MPSTHGATGLDLWRHQGEWSRADAQASLLAAYDLTEEEPKAIAGGDIGELYVLGCNGQLLMHFAQFRPPLPPAPTPWRNWPGISNCTVRARVGL